MSSCACIQTRAILAKNLALASRNPRDLFRELALPLIILVLLAALTKTNGGTLNPEQNSLKYTSE